jgi:hypothetical protein
MTFLLGVLEEVIGGLILFYLIKRVEKIRRHKWKKIKKNILMKQ